MSAEDRYQSIFDNKQSQDTYEVRVTSPAEQRLSWMVGVSRLDARFDSAGGFIFGTLFGPAAGGPPLPLAAQTAPPCAVQVHDGLLNSGSSSSSTRTRATPDGPGLLNVIV